MELKQIMNRGLLREMCAAGYIKRNDHPDDVLLSIWCYTPEAQFANMWNTATTQCRGLITYAEEIISRPFPKFFNYEQHFNVYKTLPQGHALISEKLDGSFGILYKYPETGELKIATKGSFISDQAVAGTHMLNHDYAINHIDFDTDRYTYLFEILWAPGRIVLSYDIDELVLLEVLETATGELAHGEFQRVAQWFRTPHIYGSEAIDLADLSELYKTVADDEEGFVVRYDNGVRIKVKGEEYLRLHRIVTGLTERRIWENIQTHQERKEFEKVLATVPDEFYDWATGVIDRLYAEAEALRTEVVEAYKYVATGFESRAKQAKWLKTHKPDIMAMVFSMIDDRDDKLERAIWQRIKP